MMCEIVHISCNESFEFFHLHQLGFITESFVPCYAIFFFNNLKYLPNMKIAE